jgi:cobalt-zinc-cadmium resistance protein CzcA
MGCRGRAPCAIKRSNSKRICFGGVWAQYDLSVPSSVGFIALFGVAVPNGVVMVSYFEQHLEEGQDLQEAIARGAMLRLRPVLMTATVASLGLLPLLLSAGVGSEVQRPLATVVVGGLATSTALTLVVLPVVYRWAASRSGVARVDRS